MFFPTHFAGWYYLFSCFLFTPLSRPRFGLVFVWEKMLRRRIVSRLSGKCLNVLERKSWCFPTNLITMKNYEIRQVRAEGRGKKRKLTAVRSKIPKMQMSPGRLSLYSLLYVFLSSPLLKVKKDRNNQSKRHCNLLRHPFLCLYRSVIFVLQRTLFFLKVL